MIKTYKLAGEDIFRAALAKNVSVDEICRVMGYSSQKLNEFIRYGADGWDARNLAHYLGIKI